MVVLTKKGRKFLRTEACDTSFEAVKQALDSFDVMGYPLDDRVVFVLDVVGIGRKLQKVQDGHIRVIA